jgi:phage terminase large subunit GpA-like protein
MTGDIIRAADEQPGPFAGVFPALHSATSYSQDRFDQALEVSPGAKGIFFEHKYGRSENTKYIKKFVGGQLRFLTANSTSAGKSKPIVRIYFEEINEYPQDIGGQGSPLDIFLKRTISFEGQRKVFLNSTPTTEKYGLIEAWYARGTQKECYVPCPECGHMQTLSDLQFRYAGTKPEHVKRVDYECVECKALWPESAKYEIINRYEWRAKNPDALVDSFSVWQAYNLGNSWVEIVREYLRVKDDPEKLKTYWNQTLNKSWVDRSETDWTRIYDRRESYDIGVVPADCLVLTAAIDVQKDRFEVLVCGHTRTQEVYAIDYFFIDGGPQNEAAKTRVVDFTRSRYKRADGFEMELNAVAIDSGYETQEVYALARRINSEKVFITKGQNNFMAPAVHTPSTVDLNYKGEKIKNGVKLWPVGVSQLKGEVSSLLRMRPEVEKTETGETKKFPPRYLHFPMFDEDFFKSLCSESIVQTQKKHGARKVAAAWVKHYDRNEVFDLMVLTLFLARVLGLDRFTDGFWDSISQAITGNRGRNAGAEGAPRPQRRARVISRGVDID